MAFADSSETQVAFVEEADWGVTPSNPAFQKLRITGESLGYDVSTATSDEIRADAMVGALLRTGTAASGDLSFELSFGAGDTDRLLAQALRASFAVADSGQQALDVAANNQVSRAAGSFLADGFRPGQTVSASGFADPANNGAFTVSAVAAAALTLVETGLVVETGSGDERLVSAEASTLKAGIAKPSLSLEKVFTTGAEQHYLRFSGCRAGRLSLRLAAGEIGTASLALTGKAHALDTAALAGASYAGANASPVMTAADVAQVAVGGVAASLAYSRIELEVANNLRPQAALGQLGPAGIGYGRREVTGRLVAYFEEASLYQAFVDGAASSLAFEISDGTSRYRFTLPNLRYSEGRVLAGGNDRDVLAEMAFRGLFDAAHGTDLMIQNL